MLDIIKENFVGFVPIVEGIVCYIRAKKYKKEVLRYEITPDSCSILNNDGFYRLQLLFVTVYSILCLILGIVILIGYLGVHMILCCVLLQSIFSYFFRIVCRRKAYIQYD
ncbi:hypothetical protein [Wukongibacter sp. M2B1]|uniref:hypothetical protein n=1 Tax=Wukongibacter sp. M2B1 TaxID=3088895 RepID=UPI003D7AFDB5